MTDISVIKMIISVAVWRIYPSWVNDKLRAWEGFGHSRKFWARLSRDDFRSKLEIISFLCRDMTFSKSFFVSRAFERFGAKRSSSGAFGFDDVLEVFLKTPLRHRAFFCELLLRPRVIFDNFLSFFQRAGVTWLTAMAIPRLSKALWWWYVKTRMKTPATSGRWRDRAQKDHRSSSRLVRVVCGDPSIRPNRKKKQKTQRSQRLIVRSLNPSSSTNQGVLSSLFSRPDVTTVLHFAVIVHVNVQLYSRTVRLQRGESEEKQSSVTFPVLITEA